MNVDGAIAGLQTLISIKRAHVRDHVPLVILSEGWSGWRYVSERLKLCVAEDYSDA
jgi:hypothetical protein